MKNITKRILALTIVVTATFAMTVSAGIDKKFYKKVADDVWNTPDAIFDPKTVIPDSLEENNSAVVIAWSDNFEVDHVAIPSPYKVSGMTNRLKKNHVKRKMIKLLDQSAIDDYSEFKFGLNAEITAMGRLLLYQLKSAFGAKIYKPDGRVIDVDLSDAIEIGEGKKGKEYKRYKIAIPGLEPGDILDYFFYTDQLRESGDLEPENVILCDEYPVLNRRLTISTHPAMTVEYKGYNGVPNLQRDRTEKGNPSARLMLKNIPGVNFKKYTMQYRQLPFVRIQFLNNTDANFLAKNSRNGGLYGNIHAGKIISEIGDYLTVVDYDCPVLGKATKLVKDNFLKNKPDATPKEIADAAWLAVHYYEKTAKSDKESSSGQFERALIYNDVLKRLKVYNPDSIGVGIINPRSDVPTRDISAWDESNFVVKTPDALYFMPLYNALSPGELPGDYGEETAAIYMGDRKKLTQRSLVHEYTVPGKRMTANSGVYRDTVTIADDDILHVTSTATYTGGFKTSMNSLIENPEWTFVVEEFFNIPNDKRYRDKSFDRDGRNDELKRMLKTYDGAFYGKEPDSVTTVNFLSYGITPDNPKMSVYTESNFSGLVERLGDDISVKLGQLTGMPKQLTDSERKRLLDVMLPYVTQETHVLIVKAPEGYTFDEASVNELARQVTEPVGQFIVQSQMTEDGDLKLTTVLRYKFADVPIAYWPSFMNLVDGASSFGDASVILVKK